MMEAALVEGVAYRIARDFTSLGSFALVPLYAFLLYQANPEHARWYMYGSILLIGFVVVLKFVFGKPRPEDAAIAKRFLPSFPSGHTAIAAFTAYWFGLVFERWRWVLYACAVVVGATRVIIGVHFVSDVLAGGVIGIAVGMLVHRVR